MWAVEKDSEVQIKGFAHNIYYSIIYLANYSRRITTMMTTLVRLCMMSSKVSLWAQTSISKNIIHAQRCLYILFNT